MNPSPFRRDFYFYSMAFIHDNGVIKPREELISGSPFGESGPADGFFETMLWDQGRIRFWEGHVRRMKKSLILLGMNPPACCDEYYLEKETKELIRLNGHERARIRIRFYHAETASGDGNSSFLLETEEIPQNKSSYSLCLFPHEAKQTGPFSNIKNNNYHPYRQAAQFAAEKKHDDALVLNEKGNVCDSSRANLFMVCGHQVFTPSLQEGCIAGVLREYLIDKLPALGFPVTECSIRPEQLHVADEIFLTNSVRGIMPVHEWEGSKKGATRTAEIMAACPLL